MSRARAKYNKRRVLIAGGAAAMVLSGAVIASSALAGEAKSKSSSTKAAAGSSSAGTVNCPAVAPGLPAVPASARAEIDRNLALPNTQIAEADKRVVDTVGQGGPNFIQNAILGPLKDKRVATINRMATAIGRTAAKRMGKLFDRIDGRLRSFIEEQPLFFTATAPLRGDGHVNLSPKGRSGTLVVLDELTLA
jgi:hypothetical protein